MFLWQEVRDKCAYNYLLWEKFLTLVLSVSLSNLVSKTRSTFDYEVHINSAP